MKLIDILKILSYADFIKEILAYILKEKEKADNGNKTAAVRVRLAQLALEKRNKEDRKQSLSAKG